MQYSQFVIPGFGLTPLEKSSQRLAEGLEYLLQQLQARTAR
jgi:hypothetical protein